MDTNAMRLKKLLSVPHELEAAMIVNALQENGIEAGMAGMATAGFRAEAPGEVAVLVAEDAFPPACEVLAAIDRTHADIDWSQVDVGAPEEPLEEMYPEEPSAADASGTVETAPLRRRRFQFSLGTLLLVQTAFCVALSAWLTIGPSLMAFAIVTAMVWLPVAGAIWIVSDQQRARHCWARLGCWVAASIAVGTLFLIVVIVASRVRLNGW